MYVYIGTDSYTIAKSHWRLVIFYSLFQYRSTCSTYISSHYSHYCQHHFSTNHSRSQNLFQTPSLVGPNDIRFRYNPSCFSKQASRAKSLETRWSVVLKGATFSQLSLQNVRQMRELLYDATRFLFVNTFLS